MRASIGVVLLLGTLSCGPAASEPDVAENTATATAEPTASASADEPKPSTTASAQATADVEPPAAKNPKALSMKDVCADSQAALGETLKKYKKDFEKPALGPPTVEDLEPTVMKTEGKLGSSDAGSGVWGPTDLDGDGTDDRVMEHGGIDSWNYLVFLRKGECWSYAGVLDGYQVEFTRTKAGGLSARMYVYPAAPAPIETYKHVGKKFVKTK